MHQIFIDATLKKSRNIYNCFFFQLVPVLFVNISSPEEFGKKNRETRQVMN